MKFITKISNIRIGTAFLTISNEVMLHDAITSKSYSLHIMNIHDKIIGKMECELRIILNDRSIYHSPNRQRNKAEIFSVAMHENVEIENDTNKNNLKSIITSDLKDIKRKANKIDTEMQTLPFQICERTNTNSLLNYLNGCPLSNKDEKSALNDIRTISPTGSFLDEIELNLKSTISILKNKMQKNIKTPTPQFKNQSDLDDNNIIYLNVFDLILTECGLNNISNKIQTHCLNNGMFMIEYKFDHDDTPNRIFSKNVDNHLKHIDFYCLRKHLIVDKNERIFIVISYCDSKTNKYTIIGSANLAVRPILDDSPMAVMKKLPIHSSCNVIVGTLQIKIDPNDCLNLKCNKNSMNLHSCSSSLSLHNLYMVECKCCDYLQHSQYICAKCNDHEYFYGLHGNQTNQVQVKCGANNTNSNCYTELKPMQSSSSNDSPSTNNEDTNSIQIKNFDNIEKGFMNNLSGLFYTGIINFDRYRPPNGCAFVVCQSFWSEPILADNFQNNVLNFLEVSNSSCINWNIVFFIILIFFFISF